MRITAVLPSPTNLAAASHAPTPRVGCRRHTPRNARPPHPRTPTRTSSANQLHHATTASRGANQLHHATTASRGANQLP
ncbi:hypothetical protein GCM10010172_55010 [Paractinoplanes ferrugineus]|uniref:Uncharacterized protein n=1 Tax=Paractinoplanes ferrugineus TaxID=113564 RepID=A0A919MCS8_9ACTN|nr:hypothetical protein Afe05nite_28680 [Actinoplanes ferrugineus]